MSTATANMTIADFVKEAALFNRSKEYFDIIKESHELSLMSMCIDNTEFVTESYDLSEEAIAGMAVITESTDTSIAVFQEKVGDKIANVWAAMKKGLTKIINAAIALYKHIVQFATDAKAKYDGAALAKKDPSAVISVMKEFSAEEMAEFAKAFLKSTNSITDENILAAIKYLGAKEDRFIREIDKMSADAAIDQVKAMRIKQLIMISVINARQGSTELKFRFPKFADKVFETIPMLADTVSMLENAKSAEAVLDVQVKLKKLTADLKKLHIGNSAPTIDTISSVMVTVTYDNLVAMNKKLIAARDAITGSHNAINNIADGKDMAKNSALAAAKAGVIDALANCESVLMTYAGVAMVAVSTALTNAKTIQKISLALSNALAKG